MMYAPMRMQRCRGCDGQGVVSLVRWPYDERPETPVIHHFLNKPMPMRLTEARATLLQYSGENASLVHEWAYTLLMEAQCNICGGSGHKAYPVPTPRLQPMQPPRQLPHRQPPRELHPVYARQPAITQVTQVKQLPAAPAEDEEIIDAEFTERKD